MLPPDLYGPAGLLIGLALAVAALWRDHLRADADDRTQRDRAIGLVEGLIPSVKALSEAQAEANKRQRDDA